jgi:hypothetical protein
MADFAAGAILSMAKSDWKRACKAGIVAPGDTRNPIYEDGFVVGAYAATHFLSGYRPKELTQFLLSRPHLPLSMTLQAISEELWERSRELGWGGPSRNDPIFKEAFFLGTENTFTTSPPIRKLLRGAERAKSNKMKWLGWFALYLVMWMVAAMLMTLLFHWPVHRIDSQSKDPYLQTVPGQISSLIGYSLPSAATGAVLGPLGPIVVAMQQSALSYAEALDRAQKTHPSWSIEQRATAASEARKMPAITALLLGYTLIVIAWLIRPRAKREESK